MKKNKISLNEEVEDIGKEEEDNYEDFEEISNNALSPGIQIRKLKKTYTTNFLGSTVRFELLYVRMNAIEHIHIFSYRKFMHSKEYQ